MLKIEISKKAERFIRSREPKHRRQITSKILGLRENPMPSDSESLKGSEIGERRATIGEYRIIYWLETSEGQPGTLHIDTIGKRNNGQVYRGL